MKKKISMMDVILLVLSALLCFGTKFVFHACAVGEDHIMACHWAEQSVIGVGAALTVMALITLIARDGGIRKGISLAMIPTAVLAVSIPGGLINLCMMSDMRCRSVMRPAVMIIGILIAVMALVNVIIEFRRKEMN